MSHLDDLRAEGAALRDLHKGVKKKDQPGYHRVQRETKTGKRRWEWVHEHHLTEADIHGMPLETATKISADAKADHESYPNLGANKAKRDHYTRVSSALVGHPEFIRRRDETARNEAAAKRAAEDRDARQETANEHGSMRQAEGAPAKPAAKQKPAATQPDPEFHVFNQGNGRWSILHGGASVGQSNSADEAVSRVRQFLRNPKADVHEYADGKFSVLAHGKVDYHAAARRQLWERSGRLGRDQVDVAQRTTKAEQAHSAAEIAQYKATTRPEHAEHADAMSAWADAVTQWSTSGSKRSVPPRPEPPAREPTPRAAKQKPATRPPKGTPTGVNVFALHDVLRKSPDGLVPNRVHATDHPHLRRCLNAGLIEAHVGGKLRLTEKGVAAMREHGHEPEPRSLQHVRRGE